MLPSFFVGIIISVKRKTEEKTELLRIQRDEIQEQVSKLELKLTAQTVSNMLFLQAVSLSPILFI